MPWFSPKRLPAARICRVLPALLCAAGPAMPGLAADDPGTAMAVAATGSGALTTSMEAQRLVTEQGPDGRTVRQFVPAQRLEAGEQVYYTIRVRNPGQQAVSNIVVTKALPYGVDYVPGSAVGPACRVELSSDGGQTFFSGPGKGGYTHVRWTFQSPLAPGATALLRFRAVFH
jgi:uncharacterized repeat protein (TIGR01451 family)